MRKKSFTVGLFVMVLCMVVFVQSNAARAALERDDPVLCPGDCVSLPPGYYRVAIQTEPGNPDSLQRYYNVYIPELYTGEEAVPLLLNIHGLRSSAHGQHEKTLFKEQADQHNFIIVYPEGYEESFNGWECCGEAKEEGLDDIGLMLTIVDDISGRVNIDADRIYSTGHSNGAMMSHLLACLHSDVIAAIAPASANSPVANTDFYDESVCDPLRSVPVISFMGIGYQGLWGGWYGDWYNYLKGVDRRPYGCVDGLFANLCDNRYNVGFVKDFETWGVKNGCSQYVTEQGIGEYTGDHAAYRTSYEDCDDNVEVTYYHLHADHVNVYDDAMEDGLNIAEIAWDFLSRYSLDDVANRPPRVTITEIGVEGDCISLSGTCRADSTIDTVEVQIGDSGWQLASLDGNGNWSFDRCDIADGTYATQVRVTDSEGLFSILDGREVTLNTQVACVTATNTDHKAAGRAYYSWFRYYAKGSGDYLGTASTEQSLMETDTGYWEKVDVCN